MTLYSSIIKLLIYFLLVAATPYLSQAAELEGFKFPDEITLDNEKLILNGLSVRKATIFRIKIMVAGLYLSKRSVNPDLILNSSEMKQIQIRFIKNISAKKISSMWTEQLMKRCKKDCTTLNEQADRMGKLMLDIKQADSMIFTFYKEKIKIILNNNIEGVVEGRDFSKALLSLWIGPDPLDESLKDGLLGIEIK
jgi:hypothetical protein